MKWQSLDGSEEFSTMCLYGNNSFDSAFNLPETKVEAKLIAANSQSMKVLLTNIGNNVALKIRCKLANVEEKDIYYSDNYLSLAPGESTTFEITGNIYSNILELEGWNVKKSIIQL